MSSWLRRVSKAHRIPITPFTKMLGRLLGRIGDPDRADNSHLNSYLTEQTGLKLSSLAALCRFKPQIKNPLAATLREPRFCPECWKQDAIPHVRWEWRSALVAACDIHRLELVKDCPACGARFTPLASTRIQALEECSACGGDLRLGERKRVSKQSIQGQRGVVDLCAVPEEIGAEQIAFEAIKRLVAHCRSLRRHSSEQPDKMLIEFRNLSRSGHTALSKILPGQGQAAVLRSVVIQSVCDEWCSPEPLPVRCWQTLECAAPVYAAPTQTRPSAYNVTLYDLLQRYAHLKNEFNQRLRDYQ